MVIGSLSDMSCLVWVHFGHCSRENNVAGSMMLPPGFWVVLYAMSIFKSMCIVFSKGISTVACMCVEDMVSELYGHC